MNGQVGWAELFLSADGRVSRAPFLIAAAVLIGVTALYESAVGPTLHWFTGWFVYPVLIYCGACALSKRLHDRGRSGWFAVAIIAARISAAPQPERPRSCSRLESTHAPVKIRAG